MGTSPLRPPRHRFVFSSTWSISKPARQRAGGTVFGWLGPWLRLWGHQSGSALTIGEKQNSTNVFGISEDRAQLSGHLLGKNRW